MARTARYVVLAALVLTVMAGVSGAEQMTVGTNIWYPGWGGTSSDPFVNGYTNVTGSNPWRPEFLAEVNVYSAIRFMDLEGLNSNEAPASWAARTSKSALRQMPLAFEWMVDLCNRTKTDLWLCVPYLWDQDLPGCHSLAQLIYSTLDTTLRVYVEYGNENWNTGYNQNYCRQKGAAAGLGDGALQTTGDRYSALASAQIWQQFEAVYGKGNPRLVRTLCGWDISTGTCGAQIGLLKDTLRNPQRTMPDLYCVAPYIAPCSLSQVPAMLTDIAANLRSHRSLLARAGNIPLGGYEGGFSDCNHAAIASDPAAYNAMLAYLDTLNVYMTGVFNHLNHSCDRWGAKLYIGQPAAQAPLYRALADWNAGHPLGTTAALPQVSARAAWRLPTAQQYLFTIDGRLARVVQGGNARMAEGCLLVAPYTRVLQITTER